jgi:putative transcriptional regulator
MHYSGGMKNSQMYPVRLTINEILAERNISAKEFKDMAGVSYRTALNLINDKNDRIDLDTIGKVCQALDIEPGDFIVYQPIQE